MNDEQVAAFGKLTFNKDELLPELPEMNVLIFKHSDGNRIYTHSAVCIELEIDACGNSEEEASQQLRKVITMYLQSLAQQSKTPEAFAKSVIDIIFSKSKQKTELFELYREAKQKYLLNIAQENAPRYSSLNQKELRYEPAFSSSTNIIGVTM